jgi:hypothetical protein
VRFRLLIFLILIALLSACSAETTTAEPSPVPSATAAVPTLTPTPTIPLAILVLPADLEPETSNLYQKTVYDLTQASGMRFQVRNALTVADLEPGLKIVIALFNDPVQFLAIGIPGIAAGGNVSVLGDTTQVEVVGFLSGYTAAMLADDYRTGMLMPKDNNDAIRMFNSFANGMKYYCGLCRPYFFLPWSFPQYLEIPADEDPNNYDAYADILILQRKVGTLLVHPAIQTQDLVDYIGTTGVYMIGTVTPERRPAGWVMTIRPDTVKAIQSAWPQLLAGQGGMTVQAPLGLSDVDPSLLSPGKLRLVQKTLDDLQAGLIAP